MATTSGFQIVGDGSSRADAADRVEIDIGDPIDRWRFECPNGHRNWEPSGSEIWCQQCSRIASAGTDVDTCHTYLVDLRTGETIPWSAVDLI